MVKYLVKNGADINAKIESSNRTALMITCENGYLEIVKCLVQNGADLNARDKTNKTASLDILELHKSGTYRNIYI